MTTKYTTEHREGLVDAVNTLASATVYGHRKGLDLAIDILRERIDELDNASTDGHAEVAGNQIYEAVDAEA